MELLRNSKDKKAKKLTKKRVSRLREGELSGRFKSTRPVVLVECECMYSHTQLGTLLRSKRKVEELSTIIQEQRRQAGH